VQVTATFDGVVSDAALVAVVASDTTLAQILMTPVQLELESGFDRQLQASVQTASGETLEGFGERSSFAWASSDTSDATVSFGGLVSALAPGTTSITASVDGVTSAAVSISVPGDERTGSFVRRPGTSDRVEGGVSLRANSSGGLEVVFADDFAVSTGPRLKVFLSTTQSVFGGKNIGPLQLNSGTQTYPLPSDVTENAYDWVIIHCVPFNITFGFAQLDGGSS
jgi:hypothetical protein